MALQGRAEPDKGLFVAGTNVSGKMEVECRADTGLAIGEMIVELFGWQELTSRDHSATSTFLQTRRLFQGPGLPPSNAVFPYPQPGEPPLPKNYFQSRRGISTFLFHIPLPSTSPSSIKFSGNLAQVTYELRASVAVIWKGERRLVTSVREVSVVECWEEDFSRIAPEGVVFGEHGKIWVQCKVIGDMIVAGEPGCLEVQVKNHSSKKNTGLTLILGRDLFLPGAKVGANQADLQISDVLTTVHFRGPEYIIHPGMEGVASLVFDVPKNAMGAKGGLLGDESEGHTAESLFEVRCNLSIKINMGIGTKDIQLSLPISIFHPAALPEPDAYGPTHYMASNQECPPPITPQHVLPHHITQPIPAVYFDSSQNQVWFAPPVLHHHSPPMVPIFPSNQPYEFPLYPQPLSIAMLPPRPHSADAVPCTQTAPAYAEIGIGPPPRRSRRRLSVPCSDACVIPEAEESKIDLRQSLRSRSLSPQHRLHSITTRKISQSSSNSLADQPLSPSGLEQRDECIQLTIVHSPRPLASTKRSYSSSTNASLPKSEHVEELERMAEEVANLTEASLNSRKASLNSFGLKDLENRNINKTLPPAPLPTVAGVDENKDNRNLEQLHIQLGALTATTTSTYVDKSQLALSTKVNNLTASLTSSRLKIPQSDNVFATSLGVLKAPPTPQAAITPVKVPSNAKSTEFRIPQHLAPEGVVQASRKEETGLDALERRLLAEVGTRKMEDVNGRRPDARTVLSVSQPIDIPKSPDEGPLNDSAISSLALAGEEVRASGGLLVPELDHDDGDSDDKTHRGWRSSVSGGSRRVSGSGRSKGNGDRKRQKGRKEISKDDGKRKDRGKVGIDGHQVKTRRKAEAAKGRVAAWLGGIEAVVPSLEEDAPLSMSITGLPHSPREEPVRDHVHEDLDRRDSKSVVNPVAEGGSADPEVSSAPNPRSSGFVPIGTIKHDTGKRRRFYAPTKESTIVAEAKHVTDLWLSSAGMEMESTSPISRKISPQRFPLNSPTVPRTQTIRTDRRVSPPSAAMQVTPLVGAEEVKNKQCAPVRSCSPSSGNDLVEKKYFAVSPSSKSPVNLEVKYDVRSARGGRGGQVTTLASIWGLSSAPDSNISHTRQKKPPAQGGVFKSPRAGALKSIPENARKITPSNSDVQSLTPGPNEHKFFEFAGKLGKGLVQSTSVPVPAVVSSSHATPMLSSTASLVRPPKSSRSFNVIATDVSVQAPTSLAKSSTASDLAFGKARLRDLIKKYQG